MRKTTALSLLGGTPANAAKALGCTPSAIRQWPKVLSRVQADRVIAARLRMEWALYTPDALPEIVRELLELGE